jgi:hypothetical protein
MDKLPNEIIQAVFEFCKERDLLRVAMTGRLWLEQVIWVLDRREVVTTYCELRELRRQGAMYSIVRSLRSPKVSIATVARYAGLAGNPKILILNPKFSENWVKISGQPQLGILRDYVAGMTEVHRIFSEDEINLVRQRPLAALAGALESWNVKIINFIFGNAYLCGSVPRVTTREDLHDMFDLADKLNTDFSTWPVLTLLISCGAVKFVWQGIRALAAKIPTENWSMDHAAWMTACSRLSDSGPLLLSFAEDSLACGNLPVFLSACLLINSQQMIDNLRRIHHNNDLAQVYFDTFERYKSAAETIVMSGCRGVNFSSGHHFAVKIIKKFHHV